MAQNGKMQEAQKQVDEVVDVMRSNLQKGLERDYRLNELDSRADDLQASSVQFATTSKAVKKKYWWKNLKMNLIIGGVILAVIIIIITVIAVESSGGDDNSGSGSVTSRPEHGKMVEDASGDA